MSEGTTIPMKPILRQIRIGRTYNAGNYENHRYDLTLEIPDDADPLTILAIGEKAIEALRPMDDLYEEDYKRECLRKDHSELSEYVIEQLPEWRKELEELDKKREQRAKALESFKLLGGQSSYKDAKETWEEQP